MVSEPAGGANMAQANKIVENYKAGVMPTVASGRSHWLRSLTCA